MEVVTHKQAVLQLLSDHKPHSHHELYGLGCVAHSRISDLRRDGHVIEAWREDGLYLYQLKGRLEEGSTVRDGAPSSSTPSNPVCAAVASPSAVSPSEPSTRDGGVLTLFGEAA